MDVLTAETFLTVLDVGSFSRAADVLNVTQSTVSTRIRVLEEQLGRRLLSRSKAGVLPTRAGQQFRPFAESMVWAWRRGCQEVLLPERFKGVIAVGGQFTLWDHLLLQWLPWMRREHPDVALRAEVGSSEALMLGVMDSRLDMAVLYMPRARSGVTVELLLEDQLVFVGNRPAACVSDPDYVHVDWGPEFADAFGAAHLEAEMAALTVSHGPLALQHILSHGGSGYFPLRVVYPYLRSETLFRIDTAEAFTRPVHLAYLADRADKRFRRALDGLRTIAHDQQRLNA
ncbi:LysR family transcriptional regulator [Magnetospira thiophila]